MSVLKFHSSSYSSISKNEKCKNNLHVLEESSSVNCFYIDQKEAYKFRDSDSDSTSDLTYMLMNVDIKPKAKLPKQYKKLTTQKGKNEKSSRTLGNNTNDTNETKKSVKSVKSSVSVNNYKTGKSKVGRTKKKKDSFIVSDDSASENESMTIYHRVFTEKIKADVKRMTPRSHWRRSIPSNDHGIFTPYILGRRSSSDSSFSDKENDFDDTFSKLKIRRTDIGTSLLSSTNVNLIDSIIAVSSPACDNKNQVSNAKFDLLISTQKVTETKLKETSWCFSSDDYLSCRSDDDFPGPESSSSKTSINYENILQTPPLKTKTLSTKVKTKGRVLSPTVKLPKSTPITFRLKQVNKLTPKVENVKQSRIASFLESLSTFNSSMVMDPEAEPYKKKFKKLKEELAHKLFKKFNEEVFDNQLPADMKIEWNARMRSSSGFCFNKRIKTIIGPNNECLRTSRIALSTKVIETPDRLRDTLLHEMCHAAAWIVDNKADGHGPYWKAWADKAMNRYPMLPVIKRCHDYSIKTKFQYKCVNCGYTIGRHSKSLNLERKRCGYCYNKFELIVNCNNNKNIGLNVSPKSVTARPLSKFALFVKENYAKVKSEHSDLKHGDIMKTLSKNFALTKTTA